MIGHGVATIVFEEPELTARVPACLDAVAGAMACGFRLSKNGAPNHEDVLIGMSRLQQFKAAKRAQLRREIRWHFAGGHRYEGMTLAEYFAAWDSDAALRRTVSAGESFLKWRAKIAEILLSKRPSLLAQEDGRHCYGLMYGEPVTLAAMSEFMDNGGI